MKNVFMIAVLILAGAGCAKQSESEPSSPGRVEWESPKTSIPEIKLAAFIWPEAKQSSHFHESQRRDWYFLDIGFPSLNDEELFRRYHQGLTDLGWEPITASTLNGRYQKGGMTLQASFDTGEHPTTLMLNFEPKTEDTEPRAEGDGLFAADITDKDVWAAKKPHSGPPPEESSSSIAWGEEANGLQAGLSFKGTSKKPRPRVTLGLHVRNMSESPLRILKLSCQAMFWGECIPLEVRVAGACHRYQGPVLEPPPPPPESKHVYLEPATSDSVEVAMFPEHWTITPSVEAEVTFVFQSRLQDVKDLWSGLARSGVVRVKMSP